jgi:hypothetical protein
MRQPGRFLTMLTAHQGAVSKSLLIDGGSFSTNRSVVVKFCIQVATET